MLGAFGAHALAATLDGRALEIWDTAVLYQLIHSLALLITGVIARSAPVLRVTVVAFALGIVLFCGSLYLLALGGPHVLGPLTPVGGLGFIVGWLSLGWSQRSRPDQ